MTKYDAILRVPSDLPPVPGRRSFGRIFSDTLTTGKHPFPDGTDVLTSRVEEVTPEGIVRTLSGTRYRLELVPIESLS